MEKRRVLVVGSGCEKIVGFLREKGFDARGVSRAAETAGAAEAAILLPSVGEAEARTIAETFPKAFPEGFVEGGALRSAFQKNGKKKLRQ